MFPSCAICVVLLPPKHCYLLWSICPERRAWPGGSALGMYILSVAVELVGVAIVCGSAASAGDGVLWSWECDRPGQVNKVSLLEGRMDRLCLQGGAKSKSIHRDPVSFRPPSPPPSLPPSRPTGAQSSSQEQGHSQRHKGTKCVINRQC